MNIDLHVIQEALSGQLGLRLAVLFGSCATGRQRHDSDLDIAIDMGQVKTAQQHIDIISALALATGRPIDLIDLRLVGEPLLGQILKYGKRIVGSDVVHAQYMTRHVMDMADFVPYQQRILLERRQAWIG
jgi:predicted nucleotidyltransferase